MSKFLIGDRVVRLNGSTPVPTGSAGTVARLPSDGGYDEWCYVVWDHKPGVEFFTCGRFLDPEAPRLPSETEFSTHSWFTGWERKAAGEALGSYFYKKTTKSGEIRHCAVDVFPLRVERQAKKWPEMAKRDCVWMSVQQASQKVDEPDLSQLILGFDARGMRKSA